MHPLIPSIYKSVKKLQGYKIKMSEESRLNGIKKTFLRRKSCHKFQDDVITIKLLHVQINTRLNVRFMRWYTLAKEEMLL